MPYAGLLSDIGFYNFPTSKPVKMADLWSGFLRGWAFDFGGCRGADLTAERKPVRSTRREPAGFSYLELKRNSDV